MESPSPTLTAALDGYALWLGEERLLTAPTREEAIAAYRAARDLAEAAKDQLMRTLERV